MSPEARLSMEAPVCQNSGLRKSRADRIGALETEVAWQREELDELKRQFADFRRQFE